MIECFIDLLFREKGDFFWVPAFAGTTIFVEVEQK